MLPKNEEMINASFHALHIMENVEILLPKSFGLHVTLYKQMKAISLFYMVVDEITTLFFH